MTRKRKVLRNYIVTARETRFGPRYLVRHKDGRTVAAGSAPCVESAEGEALSRLRSWTITRGEITKEQWDR